MEKPSRGSPRRRPPLRLAGLACVAAAIAWSSPAAALDIAVTFAVQGGRGATTQTQYISATHVSVADERQQVILTLGGGPLTVVDRRHGAFYETAVADLDAARARPEVPRVTVGVPGGTRRIAGLACTQFTLSAADVTLEVWVTTMLPHPIGLVEALKVPYAVMPTRGPEFAALLDEVGRIEGYPLAFVWRYNVLGLAVETTSEATQIRHEALAPTTFIPPPGLTRRPSPFLPAPPPPVAPPRPAPGAPASATGTPATPAPATPTPATPVPPTPAPATPALPGPAPGSPPPPPPPAP